MSLSTAAKIRRWGEGGWGGGKGERERERWVRRFAYGARLGLLTTSWLFRPLQRPFITSSFLSSSSLPLLLSLLLSLFLFLLPSLLLLFHRFVLFLFFRLPKTLAPPPQTPPSPPSFGTPCAPSSLLLRSNDYQVTRFASASSARATERPRNMPTPSAR